VEGPGNIIEVDESGLTAGRGYKHDNKYAISYTNYFTKNYKQRNVVIAPGQTFCVLTCSTPGETVLTAYAPEVYNAENGKVTVRVLWGDGRFLFPQPAVTRCGTEYALTTTITNAANGPDLTTGGFRVRYRLLDGPPATLTSRLGAGAATNPATGGGQEIETSLDANGSATVQLLERDARPGKSRIAIEVVRPSDTGSGAPVVVARKDTVVEWADPKVSLSIAAPKVASLNATYPVTVSLENESGAGSKDVQVKVTLSDGATLAKSEPPPVRQDANGALYFAVPPVGGKTNQSVMLDVKPARLGQVTVIADAVTTDGMQATHKATTKIDQGRLQVAIEAPPVALTAEPIPFKVAVTNSGATPAENVNVWAQFDNGLTYPSPQNPVELSAGTIGPGQTKMIDLPLTAKVPGHFAVRANATGDGNLSARANPVGVDVKRAELTATAAGPKMVYLNQEFDWTITVGNLSETPVSNTVVRAKIPPEVRVTAASDGGKVGPGTIEWKVSDLKPNEQRAIKVSATALKLTAKASLSVSVVADVVNGTQLVGDPLAAKADSAVAIIGTPALVLNVATPPATLEVGKTLTYQIQVKNQGTVSARTVDVTAYVPAELKAVQGTGPNAARVDATGKVTFPTVDELKPGATLTLTVQAQGAQLGDARFRAEVKAAHLTKALQEEQSTKVTGK
jgi:uncharacterized repeat protein (TIGR01451 family)